jgi:hypothetical protein
MDHMRKANLRVISFLLMLIFSQKLVLGLWLHNWLHERRSNHSSVTANNGSAVFELQSAKCNCIDDALMPLTKSNPLKYQGHRPHLISILLIAQSAAFSRDVMIPALRGPPSARGQS